MATPMTAAQWKAAMTKWKVPVTYRMGWETHGRPNRPWGGVNGIMVHHTGSDTNTAAYVNALFAERGMRYPELPGPLCHASTGPDGVTTIGATKRANHAGAGSATTFDRVVNEDYPGYISELKPGLNKSVDGNTHFYGNEVRFSGAHAMTDKQYAAVVRWCAAICDHHKWSALSIIGHREWTSAKPDPGHTPMDKLRADVAALLKSGTAPVPAYVSVRSDDMNVAGYNARGISTWKSRTALIGGDVIAADPDVFNTQELSAKSPAEMRDYLDKLLGPEMRRVSGGSDGRYNYLRDGIHRVASGRFETKYLYMGDTKQAAWVVFEKKGIRAMDVSFHLESDNGQIPDGIRVKQMLDFLAQTIAKAKSLSVSEGNILLIGDTNSENLVRNEMAKKGWKSVGKGDADELDPTFNGWGRASTRIDYGFVKNSTEVTAYAVTNKTSRSDHARLTVVRKIK